MKRSILCFTLSLGFYFAFGQCGPYTISAIDSPWCWFMLNVSGATDAQQIVWNLNGVAFDTVYRGPNGSTVAGGNGNGSAANQLSFPNGLCLDAMGNVYVVDYNNNRIQKFPSGGSSATNGVTVAGGNGQGSAANQLILPTGVFLDGSGNIYVADAENERIQKFPPGSTSATNGTTVAGGNGFGSAANQLSNTIKVFVNSSGDVYVCDAGNYRIQKFPAGSTSATNGITVAGGNGRGSAANQFDNPTGVYVDSSGNIYVTDDYYNRIQKFPAGSTSATNGTIIAGGNGLGSAANQLFGPQSVCGDNYGNIYVCDAGNYRIQKFPPGSTSSTNGVTVAGGNGAGRTSNQLTGLAGVYVDVSGNIYVADNGSARIQKWEQPAMIGMDTSFSSLTSAGSYSVTVTDSAGCVASSNNVVSIGPILSSFSPNSAIEGDTVTIHGQHLTGVNYVTFGSTSASRFFVLNDSTIIALVGAGSSGTIEVSNSCFLDSLIGFRYLGTGGQCGPYTMSTTDSSCTSFLLTLSGASTAGQIIWEVNGVAFDTTYEISPGTTVAGGNGLGGAANQLYDPYGVYVDGAGYIYVADQLNHRIQKFPPGSTSATNGTTIAGGNGPGSAANQLDQPNDVCVDAAGNIYVADLANYRVQKFPAGSTSATNGTTVAGGNGAGSGANQFENPSGLCLDGSGNLYVADFINNRIQKFPPGSTSATNGATVAGGNGQGSAANQLYYPTGVYVDGSGNLYVADQLNNRIQEFVGGSTSGTTVAGGNGQGSASDQFYDPVGVYVDGAGNIYVADFQNSRIQEFPAGSTSATSGTTIAGYGGVGSNANQLGLPTCVRTDTSGNIYVADNGNNRIQKFKPIGIDTTILVTSSGAFSAMVTDTAGCIALSDTISAHPGVNAYFTLEPSGTPHLWYIVNQCNGPGTLTYVWNWGDGTSTTGDTPSHTYSTAGYYNVCVTATSSMGCSASYCDSNVYLFKDQSGQIVYVNVVYQIPNGISEITGQSPIHLYPNPNKGSFTLETSGSIGSEYIISDMLGNVIMQQAIRSDKQLIELPEAAEGVYTLAIKGASPMRFVIVR